MEETNISTLDNAKDRNGHRVLRLKTQKIIEGYLSVNNHFSRNNLNSSVNNFHINNLILLKIILIYQY